MPTLELKPTHKVVAAYYASLAKFSKLGIKHETAVRSAFQELLESCARQFDWKLIPEYRIKRKGQADASADGALLDNYGLNHGLWEAKDSDDDLEKEIKHKFSIGYPKTNILFWQPEKAVLYQNGERFNEADLTEVFAYKLGNRSALEWVIDQYRVAKDDQGNLTSDPNRMDDEEYIVRLIGQVITVSLETMKVVENLPPLHFA